MGLGNTGESWALEVKVTTISQDGARMTSGAQGCPKGIPGVAAGRGDFLCDLPSSHWAVPVCIGFLVDPVGLGQNTACELKFLGRWWGVGDEEGAMLLGMGVA